MKNIFKVMLSISICLSSNLMAQERYLEEVFDDVKVTSDIIYATNIAVFFSDTTAQDLKLDIYEPEGDTVTARPLIIMFHSGNFLPHPINGSTSGSKTDNAVVSMAERLSKMGYVVASATYRLGWNPFAATQTERVRLLINALYRSVQDANTSIRFFKKSVDSEGNPFGIDPDRIVLWGFGTGGLISVHTSILDSYEMLLIPKFMMQDSVGNSIPMVSEELSGDPEGLANTTLNMGNHTDYDSDFQLCVNLAGGVFDTTWMHSSTVPMISFHVTSDPIFPYKDGVIIIPPVLPLVYPYGSFWIQHFSNQHGNNDAFVQANLDDVYTQTADARNDGYEGLFPFLTSNPLDGAPWEWWESTNANNANGLMTNPDMSFEKANLYADSIIGYFAPRAYVVLNLATSVDENFLPDTELKAMPNPAHSQILVATTSSEPIREITLMDINGKVVQSYKNVDHQYFTVHRNDLAAGVYMLHARLDKGVITKKIIFQ